MPRRAGDAFEAQLEHVDRLDMPDGSEPLARVPPDPPVHLCNLFVYFYNSYFNWL